MSESWQWVFSIIGLVAFLMATPTFIQMIWGRPKLAVFYEVRELDKNTKVLLCNIGNVPITNPILKYLLVSRTTIDDLSVEFEILNRINKQKIGDTLKAILRTQQGQTSERVTLPASFHTVIFPIAQFDTIQNKAFVADTTHKQEITLNGVFIAKVMMYYADKTEISAMEFFASDKPPYIALGDKLTIRDL